MAQRGHAAQKRGLAAAIGSVRMAASGLVGEVYRPGAWGPRYGELRERLAGNWFLLGEEGRDPGAVIASAIDGVAGAAESLEIDACSRRSLPRCSARVAPVSCRIVWQTTARVGPGESSRAARRRGRARGPRRHPHALGERAVRLLRRRRRPFSVAGRSGPAPIATGTVQRREPTLSLTKYRGSRPVTLRRLRRARS